MFNCRPIEEMRPVEWQFLSMLSLFSSSLHWPAWREILRVSCGSPEPTMEELARTYLALVNERRIRAYGNSCLFIYLNEHDLKKARCLAAAAYGPIDYMNLHRLVLHARRASGEEGIDVDQEPSASGREDELRYLADISLKDKLTERLDAYVADFGAAPTIWDSLDGTPFGRLDGALPPVAEELSLPVELEDALFAMKPPGDGLDRLVEAAGQHASLRSEAMARRIGALLVWAWRGDLLERYAALLGDGGAAAHALALAKGFFEGGWRTIPAGAAETFEGGGNAERALVALLAAKFAPPPYRLSVNIAQMIRDLRDDDPGFASFLDWLSSMWTQRCGSLMPSRDATPLGWLGFAVMYAESGNAVSRVRLGEISQALDVAAAALKCGWTFLGAQLCNLLTQYPETSERALALLGMVPDSMPMLWVRRALVHPWEAALDDLENALAPLKPARRGPVTRKRVERVLSALIDLDPIDDASMADDAGGELLEVSAVSIAIPRRMKDGSVETVEKACSWKAFKKAFQAGELAVSSDTSAAISAFLEDVRPFHFGETTDMTLVEAMAQDVLQILLGAGDTAMLYVRTGSGNCHALDPGDIEARDIWLETEARPDGSFAMKVPPLTWWTLETPIFVRSGGQYVWWRLPQSMEPVVKVLERHGVGKGKVVVVGAEGVERARAMLGAAASAGLPVRGAVSSAGDDASLDRISGESRLVVRLERHVDELRLTLRARPLSDMPDLLFPPGRGKAEVVVKNSRRPFMLVRDIAGETGAAEAFHAALADFDAGREGESEWSAIGIERILPLLERLRDVVAESHGAFAAEWREPPSNRITVDRIKDGDVRAKGSARRWFTVEGEYELEDGESVALHKLVAAMPLRVGGYLPMGGGSWVRLTAQFKRELEILAVAAAMKDGELRVSRAALPMLAEAFAGGGEGGDDGKAAKLPAELAEAADKISKGLSASHSVPDGLMARLRPYQIEGYEWLARLASCGLGACLADDMGLGKTVQLLALLLERAGDGPSLVVAPASVCGNWCAEASRFAPSLNVIRAADSTTLPGDLSPGDLVVTSYGMLATRIDQFAAVKWNGAILDEAQAIKNAETRRSDAARSLNATWRCVATGTPVENRLSDLWSIFEFLNPGLLGTMRQFRERFTDEKGNPVEKLGALVRPLILRRLKGDVLRDLPPKTEITIGVEPGKEERDAYEAMRKVALDDIVNDRGASRIKVIAAITRLRRYCCSPSLAVAGAGTGAKLEALEGLLADLRENGHRALVFSQFTDVLALVKPILERNGWEYEYLDGSTPQKERIGRVDAFQRGSAPFFLISLKAGGTGLNLTAASYVVLLDPWWNPAVEDQAADRAHRIGQKNPVTVYRLVVKGTIEEKVLELHDEKRQLSSAILDGTSDSALSADDLIALLKA